jgi:hypothetical protein
MMTDILTCNMVFKTYIREVEVMNHAKIIDANVQFTVA